MSVKKDLGKVYCCDICGEEHTAKSYPKGFSKISIEANSNGFAYYFKGDVCKKCLPYEYFTDPVSKEKPPEGLIKKLASKMVFKMSWVLGGRKT